MYQSRKEDLNTGLTALQEHLNDITQTLNHIENRLSGLYNLKGRHYCVHFYTDSNGTFYPLQPDSVAKRHKDEIKETRDKLRDGVLEAYIVFLEGEREALIKEWNSLTKSK